MKKNKEKSAYWYKDNISRYKVGFLLFNFVLFAIVFLVFTAILKIFVEERFTYNVEHQIIRFDNDIDYVSNDGSNSIGTTTIEDPRITAVYYYTDPKNLGMDQMLSPSLTGYQVFGSLGKEDVTPIKDIKNQIAGEYVREEILGYNFMTYVAKKWYKAFDEEMQKDQMVCYVKIYMNIDGELTAKKELNTAFLICTLGILLLGYVSSFLIMKRSMKPIQVFIDKQISFVSDASHELRTPIAIVTSQIENLFTRPSATISEVSEDLAVSLTELRRLNKLVGDLLSLARSDQNRLTYNMERCNIGAIIRETSNSFVEMAVIDGKEFIVDAEDTEAFIDKDKTRELMIILFDNAMKYTNRGDKIEVLLKLLDNNIIVEVRDTGIGISEETKEKIFERFYREDKARGRETGGNGLGLSIAKTITTDMGGKILVDHNEPKGTVFTITLPKPKPQNRDSK